MPSRGFPPSAGPETCWVIPLHLEDGVRSYSSARIRILPVLTLVVVIIPTTEYTYGARTAKEVIPLKRDKQHLLVVFVLSATLCLTRLFPDADYCIPPLPSKSCSPDFIICGS